MTNFNLNLNTLYISFYCKLNFEQYYCLSYYFITFQVLNMFLTIQSKHKYLSRFCFLIGITHYTTTQYLYIYAYNVERNYASS